MDLNLSSQDRALQESARDFAQAQLFPNEMAIEEHGRLPTAIMDEIRKRY